jgi:GNAT superfamily N-acetyltransferase
MGEPFAAVLSPLDEMRFGVRTAKMNPVSLEDVHNLELFCKAQAVRLSITRVPVERLDLVQAMEQQGYHLMDTLLYFVFNFARTTVPASVNSYLVRPVDRATEAQSVRAIAAESFKGYFGHYHADPRLDPEACDEVYRSWAENSVLLADVAHEVLVVENDGMLSGFLTLRRESDEVGHIVLAGVLPESQRRGLYQAMIIQAMYWCRQQGLARLITSTQITNSASQKTWARLGFEFDHAYYTLHKWF